MAATVNAELVHRRNLVATALGFLDSSRALEILEALASQPRASADVAAIVVEDLGETEQLLRELERGGLVQVWTKGAWQLSPLGAELLEAIEPLLRRGVGALPCLGIAELPCLYDDWRKVPVSRVCVGSGTLEYHLSGMSLDTAGDVERWLESGDHNGRPFAEAVAKALAEFKRREGYE